MRLARLRLLEDEAHDDLALHGGHDIVRRSCVAHSLPIGVSLSLSCCASTQGCW
jgi:hypothetical protein